VHPMRITVIEKGKLVTICPTSRPTFVVFRHKTDELPAEEQEVVCWALVEDKDGYRSVVPVVWENMTEDGLGNSPCTLTASHLGFRTE